MASREQYSSCIGDGMRGKKLTKDQRKMEFCIVSKLCSGKTKSRDEALRICSMPKPPKPAGEKKQRRSKAAECPEFDTMSLLPDCELKFGKLVKRGELPADSDVNGLCRIILE